MEAAGVAAEERWASLCNCVVNFLLEERYHLTALELLQELQEDGRHAQALRLRYFFSDPAFFPPDLVARASSAPPGTTIPIPPLRQLLYTSSRFPSPPYAGPRSVSLRRRPLCSLAGSCGCFVVIATFTFSDMRPTQCTARLLHDRI
jgi:hypothetical protein